MKVLIVILFSFLLFGCMDQPTNIQSNNSMGVVFIEKARDCEYVIYDGYKSGGIVHAGDCKNSIHYEHKP